MIHTQDQPYQNKLIKDYDLLETICCNDQATGHCVMQYGGRIGTQMEYNSKPNIFPLADRIDDAPFGEANVYCNTSPLIHSQPNTFEPVLATSPTQTRKVKGKRKANINDDTIHELATTIKDAFDSIRSNRSVRFARKP